MFANRRPWPLAVGMVLALVAALGVAAPTMATFPGENGRITFMRQDDQGFWQTWVARADLSHERKLTNLPTNSGWSVWSPDGSRIAFDSDRTDADPSADPLINDIFTMKPNGTGLRKLTDSVGANGAPAYSPDGRLIAFESDRGDYPAGVGIYVMKATDGSGLRRITTLPAGGTWDGAPRFSPNGKKLVFTRFRSDWAESAVHTVNLDGSGLRRLTPWDLTAGDADWSPDGKQIVFELDTVRDGRGDAYIVRSDGTGLRNLTKGAAVPESLFEGFSDPVWSPDGSLILVGYGLYTKDEVFTYGFATIRPDSTDLHYVKGEGNFEHQPDWGRAPRH